MYHYASIFISVTDIKSVKMKFIYNGIQSQMNIFSTERISAILHAKMKTCLSGIYFNSIFLGFNEWIFDKADSVVQYYVFPQHIF